MLQIGDVVVSFDVLKEKFLCDLSACHGACCIEGDAGAPLELDEIEKIEEVLPLIWEELSPEAQAIIDKQGVAYVDREGDLVTSIVNGKDCVFTQKENLPVYKFLKEPLIRKFGADWYAELETAVEELEKQNYLNV